MCLALECMAKTASLIQRKLTLKGRQLISRLQAFAQGNESTLRLSDRSSNDSVMIS